MEGKREFDLVIEEISDEINVMTGAYSNSICYIFDMYNFKLQIFQVEIM